MTSSSSSSTPSTTPSLDNKKSSFSSLPSSFLRRLRAKISSRTGRNTLRDANVYRSSMMHDVGLCSRTGGDGGLREEESVTSDTVVDVVLCSDDDDDDAAT